MRHIADHLWMASSSEREPVGISDVGFLHQTNSVSALNETQSIVLVLSEFTTGLL